MKKTLIILNIICWTFAAVNAQDFQWSQIHLNPLYLNPAYSGFANKANRLSGLYRDQWRSVPVPFSTTFAGYDRKISQSEDGWRTGIGVQMLYDKSGDGALSSFRPVVSLAGGKYFNGEKQLLHIGIQGAYVRKQIDFSKLTFDTQYDGVIYNPNLDPGEPIAGDNAGYFDLGAGINFSSKLKEAGMIDIGFSAYNLTSPSYAFLAGANAEVSPRIMAYTRADVKLGQSAWEFSPGVYFQNQREARQTLLQGLFSVKIGKPIDDAPPAKLTFGPGYRVGDAVVGYVGFKWKDLRVGFAFDGNVSDFNVATSGRGAYELAVNYEWEKKKKPEPVIFDEPVIEEEKEEEEEKVVEEVVQPEPERPVVVRVDPVDPLKSQLTQFETDLKMLPPVLLFFDNDQPNPRTRLTETNVTYQETFDAYKANKSKFVEQAGENFENFFNNRVERGFTQLNETLTKMEALLKNGKTAVIELRGFASPLSNPSYNEALSKRRISSIINYLSTWNNGALKSYIEGGKLLINTNPFGDSKAVGGVSADPKDKKNSIYSTDASIERRVELTIIRID
jgi:type IX secretion system PorP/SprF family membrane protein